MNRPIHEIADDIYRDWRKPNFGAVPYMKAMKQLSSIKDNYICDPAMDIVARFLCNASTWRGDVAKSVKAELKQLMKYN